MPAIARDLAAGEQGIGMVPTWPPASRRMSSGHSARAHAATSDLAASKFGRGHRPWLPR
jgi:hypothetical protein